MSDPLSARRHLQDNPLLGDERLVLAIVVEQIDRRDGRVFKYAAHEHIEAAGIATKRRKQIIRRLVDRGAIRSGWHNVGARSDPDPIATYEISSREAVAILLEGTVRPGRRQRPSSLAERVTSVMRTDPAPIFNL